MTKLADDDDGRFDFASRFERRFEERVGHAKVEVADKDQGRRSDSGRRRAAAGARTRGGGGGGGRRRLASTERGRLARLGSRDDLAVRDRGRLAVLARAGLALARTRLLVRDADAGEGIGGVADGIVRDGSVAGFFSLVIGAGSAGTTGLALLSPPSWGALVSS